MNRITKHVTYSLRRTQRPIRILNREPTSGSRIASFAVGGGVNTDKSAGDGGVVVGDARDGGVGWGRGYGFVVDE